MSKNVSKISKFGPSLHNTSLNDRCDSISCYTRAGINDPFAEPKPPEPAIAQRRQEINIRKITRNISRDIDGDATTPKMVAD